MTTTFVVDIVYALPDKQTVKQVHVTADTTVDAAIEQSGILQQYPEIDLTKNSYGIFNHIVSANTPLKPRDRIEIYRALVMEPREARRQLAARGLTMGGGVKRR